MSPDILDEYGDWLNRPVGETVARLCVALGLEPDSCIKHGDKWMVRRPDPEHEDQVHLPRCRH